ncbi:1-acyl-sn-glycerol-3-phosphate acyltransferase [Pelosinus sp. UFO1]|uniref:lysophospholipid acyltransferase family protein n=1 Tax=Pelosinus sp. UFO1 TaxID=484770 RepID=UPI0004D11EAD|nr:lysophospholipid acyltransferase family protein [Pelosinus sp. UFO1]AIF51569.1 1-acyl-sn-glycerol-3-phosphate acyltransferase [Pelosinus sp. UFO1]
MYNVVRVFLHYFFKVIFRCKIIGADNIPSHGGAIIAANHVSLFDPPVVGTAFARPIHFMAKEELFAKPVLKWIFTKLKAFPVRRATADRTAIRHAITLLNNGELLGLFPEGTRSKTGKLGKPETGLAMIALKSGAPVVPAAIIGTNKVWKDGLLLPRFIVKFGNPITVEQGKADKEAMENLSNRIMQEISHLLEER